MIKFARFRSWRPYLIRIGIVLGVWLLILLVLDDLVMPVYVRRGSEIRVPDLRGLTLLEAEQRAAEGNVLVVLQDSQYVADVPEGAVVEQFPLPGLEAKPGRRVHVIIAAGTPTTIVPYVVGLSREGAVLALESAGLAVDTIRYAFSDSVFEDQVMTQRPDFGRKLERNSRVRFTVSLGREPLRIVVPDVLDLPYEQARYLILKAGLTVGKVSYDSYVGRRAGAVMNQSLPPKTEARRGDPVDLEVNRRGGPAVRQDSDVGERPDAANASSD